MKFFYFFISLFFLFNQLAISQESSKEEKIMRNYFRFYFDDTKSITKREYMDHAEKLFQKIDQNKDGISSSNERYIFWEEMRSNFIREKEESRKQKKREKELNELRNKQIQDRK